ncbi:MAG: STAS/SEC14 domain-containing protein [Myxococcales bacterium]|nr:STAS/SEC14 domain-containing protein [Myxococcales bacterium]MCB9752351.1 STAS/SEC14 domain-containing protein [Myxococcales bacterium]
MLETIDNLPEGIIGVKAEHVVTRKDYERVLEPLLERARADGQRVRFLYQFGPEFERFSGSGAWEDFRFGIHSLRQLEGCAIVSDLGWIRESTRFIRFFMPCAVQVYRNEELEHAVEWLRSLPAGGSTSHRLLEDVGVLVVEPGGPLRAQDFDALSASADRWIEAHGELAGLVIHTRAFPGWESLGSFFRHIRFVRDHHQHLRRIALAADTKLASVAPKIAEHFVKAEVRTFAFDELDGAIAWAGGRPAS